MVIQLPRDIEERLNDLADHEGKPADQLAVDAIEAMLMRSEFARRWPPPKVVGIVDGRSDVDDRDAAESSDLSRPWSGMIGILSDGGVPVTEFDEWLAAARAIDERLARKTSLKG